MRKLVLFITILALCAMECSAQAKVVNIPKANCHCLADSQAVDSAKEMARIEKYFRIRTAQRLQQIDGCLAFIGKDTDSIRTAYYKRQMLNMFDDSTKVTVKRKRHKSECVDIRSFLENVIRHKVIVKSIDSICVPVWNANLIKNADTLRRLCSESEMIPFKRQLKFGKEDDTLPIIKENTEEGAEWIPLFGNMVVTVKKKRR